MKNTIRSKMANNPSRIRKTWTKKRIVVIVVIAIVYGLWFNYLDSAAYTTESGFTITAGMLVGGLWIMKYTSCGISLDTAYPH